MNLSRKIIRYYQRIAPIYALIAIFSIGTVNSLHSNKFPDSTGSDFFIDLIVVAFSNPYALLDGVLIFILFNRASLARTMRDKGKTDPIFILLAILILIFTYALANGTLVY